MSYFFFRWKIRWTCRIAKIGQNSDFCWWLDKTIFGCYWNPVHLWILLKVSFFYIFYGSQIIFFSNGLLYGYYCALCCSDFPATTHQETLRLHLTSHGHKLSYFRRQYFTSYKEITQWPAYGNEALRDFDLEEYFEDEVLKLNAKEFAQE